MRIVLFIVLTILCYSSATFTQIQPEMNQEIFKKYKEADKILNETYQQILKKYEARETFIKNLKNVQRCWIKYRDAQFEMTFPQMNSNNWNTLSDSQAVYLTKLTNERTKILMEILDPTMVDLIAFYPFNGNANDASGNGNHGIVHEAFLTADRFGNNNSAYLFNGRSSISIPELFPESCAAFTIAAWVTCNVKDFNGHTVLYKGIQQGEVTLCITGGKMSFAVNLHVPGTPTSSQNWYTAGIPDTLKSNVYYFLVGRYVKGKKVEFLINGKIAESIPIPNLNLMSDPNRTSSVIGTHGHPQIAPSSYWNGIIDDIRIYTRALSDNEVQSLYHEGGWTGN